MKHAPIVPSEWALLSPMLDLLLEAAPGDRAPLLRDLSAGDSTRHQQLSALLDACARGLPLLDESAGVRFDTLADESDAPALPEWLSDRYQVGRELGRGGMARVYLAQDHKHGREVAIKAIRPEIAAALGPERFLREIEIAARLRHPNIVPLYDSGQVDGTLYFVMPYENEPSMRARLAAHGPLPIAEARSILRDVARALDYAHTHGVVHRDIKPDNVLLSSGAAVVTDFGIAKAVRAARTMADAKCDADGTVGWGSPAYMAPEQAAGDPDTDHRADIYAFGCLAYELFTGRPPFIGQTARALADLHQTQDPAPITSLRPDVPPQDAMLIARCLAKAPADRPQQVGDLLPLLDVRIAATGGRGDTRARRRRVTTRIATGTVGLLVFGIYAATRPSPAEPSPISLAVLPFRSAAADTMHFLAAAMAEEVAISLMQVPGIHIKNRVGARRLRSMSPMNIEEAGARLEADLLLSGAIQRHNGRWLLAVALTRVADSTALWSDTFPLRPDQQADAVSVITRNLLTALQRRFPDVIAGNAVPASTGTSNNGAFTLYLRAQEKLNRRGLDVSQSAELFRQAIHEDTTFARAYAGLGMALALFPYFQSMPTRTAAPDAVRAARRALELTPSLAQPHVVLGLIHQYAYHWDSAAVEFRTAILLDPRDVEARVQYGRHLLFRGRYREAMEQLQTARQTEPASAVLLSWIAYAHYVAGAQDSALLESGRALQLDSLNLTSNVLGAFVRVRSGQLAAVRELAARLNPEQPAIGYFFAAAGDRRRAQQILNDIERSTPRAWQGESKRAFTLLGLRRLDDALEAFDRAITVGEMWPLLYAFNDPIYDAIRDDPRYEQMLRRVGLTLGGSAPRAPRAPGAPRSQQ